MIEHVWTVFCSQSVIDRDSNNISLHNVIEQLTIREEPAPRAVVPATFEVVTLWARLDFDVPSRGRARLTFVSPSGSVLDPQEYDIDLSQFHRHRQRSRFQGLPVREHGRHAFLVELQNEDETTWHQVAAVPVGVVFAPRQREGAGG